MAYPTRPCRSNPRVALAMSLPYPAMKSMVNRNRFELGTVNPVPPAGSAAASDVARGDMGLGDWVWAEADQAPQTSPLAAVAHATSRGARIENPPDEARHRPTC